MKKPLDYETAKTAKFMVTASDNGHPQLTSTATINVAVVNINDETPIFTKVTGIMSVTGDEKLPSFPLFIMSIVLD